MTDEQQWHVIYSEMTLAAIRQALMIVSSNMSVRLSLSRLVVCQYSRGAGMGAGHVPGLPERNKRWPGPGHFQDRRRLAQTWQNETHK